jgi:flavodoxin
MRILVTYGSRRGGTRGLAQMAADGLRAEGFDAGLNVVQWARAIAAHLRAGARGVTEIGG